MKTPSSQGWRYANHSPRIFLQLNPALFLFFIFTVFCFYTWSLVLTGIVVIFFAVIEHKGVSAMMALRWLLTQLSGRMKRILL